MARTLLPELEQKINDIKATQNRIETNLQDSKDKLKATIVDSIKKVMTKEDFIHNEDYKKYFEKKHAIGTTVDNSEIDNWIDTLEKTQKIDLIAEYSKVDEYENGKNNWESDLKDAQAEKDVTKKAIAIQAKKVIEQFKSLSVEHDKLITVLKGKVKDKQAEIKEKDNDLKDIEKQITENLKAMQASKNYTPTPEQIDIAKKTIDSLNAKKEKLELERDDLISNLSVLETELDNMEEQKDVYKLAIETAVSELEESLKKEKIYVGSYEGLGNNENDSSANSNNMNNSQITGSGSVQNGVDERKPRDIAKAMMVDFDNLGSTEIMEMIDQIGYEDLLNMSRNLGPINRRKLRVAMENILSAQEKENIIVDGDVKISKDDLKNLKGFSEEQFSLLISTMENYTKNFKNMKVHERKEAESIMETLKIAVLLTESHTNIVGRATRKLSHKGKSIENIGAELRRFANEKENLEAFKWNKNQSLRNMLKIKTPISPMSRKKNMDRSGTKPIQRQSER